MPLLSVGLCLRLLGARLEQEELLGIAAEPKARRCLLMGGLPQGTL